MRISDWSSDVCSSDLRGPAPLRRVAVGVRAAIPERDGEARRRPHRRPVAGDLDRTEVDLAQPALDRRHHHRDLRLPAPALRTRGPAALPGPRLSAGGADRQPDGRPRSEEHTSELQSLMRISYAVFCLKKKKNNTIQ